ENEREHDEERDLEQLHRDFTGADVEVGGVPDGALTGRVGDPSEPEEDDAEEDGPADVVHGQLDVADPDAESVEVGGDVVEPAEDVECGEGDSDPLEEL